MRGPLKRLGGAVLLLVLVAALAGCMRVDRSLQVNDDGSGVYTLTISFRQPLYGVPASVAQTVVAPMDAFGVHVRQTGGSYQRTDDQGYATWTYSRPFASVIAADTMLQEDPRQNDPTHAPVLYRDSLHIARETRLSSAVLHVTGTISLVDLLHNAQDWVDATETVSITMSGGIVSWQGGTRQGNTVTYTIHYNQSATIDVMGRIAGASAVLFTYGAFIGAGMLATVSVALFVLGVWLLRGTASRTGKPVSSGGMYTGPN